MCQKYRHLLIRAFLFLVSSNLFVRTVTLAVESLFQDSLENWNCGSVILEHCHLVVGCGRTRAWRPFQLLRLKYESQYLCVNALLWNKTYPIIIQKPFVKFRISKYTHTGLWNPAKYVAVPMATVSLSSTYDHARDLISFLLKTSLRTQIIGYHYLM